MHFEYSQCLILSLVAESKVTYMRNMFEKCEKSTRQNGRKSEDEKPPSKDSHLISPGTLLLFDPLLSCPIVNENSGPKRVTHHIFCSVQKIAVVQRKKRVILTLPHRISNPKSLISLQPTKAFMRLS